MIDHETLRKLREMKRRGSYRQVRPGESTMTCFNQRPKGKLADFGLGLAPGPAVDCTAGTPTYMAPEQLRGESLDARGDQFSFCVALHGAIYDTHPFSPTPGARFEPTSRAALDALLARLVVPLPPRCPPGHDYDPVWRILSRGLAPAPAARYPSMRELLLDLQACSAPTRPARADRVYTHIHRERGIGIK